MIRELVRLVHGGQRTREDGKKDGDPEFEVMVFELDLNGQIGLRMQLCAKLHDFSLFMRWERNIE
jgi:hypothetical protein